MSAAAATHRVPRTLAAADRAWRMVLIAYLIPVTIVTHWPRLGFEGAGTVDKCVHFIGFGLIAWFAMQARLFGRAWTGFLFGVAWVYIDEVTQAIPILGRTFSGYDMIAGWIGVAIAGGIALARAQRWPAAQADAMRAALYGDWRCWRTAALYVIACVVIAGGGALAWHAGETGRFSLPAAVYPVALGSMIGVMATTGLLELTARASVARAPGAGTAAAKPSIRNWSAAALGALVLAVELAVAGFVAHMLYGGVLHFLFGAAPDPEHAVDLEGFLVMHPCFVIAGAVLLRETAWASLAQSQRRSKGQNIATL